MRHLVNGDDRGFPSIADRGLAYGDGLFETIAVVRGQLVLAQSHLARIEHGCARLAIPITSDLLAALLDDTRRLMEANGFSQGIVKWIVTRGEGGRGYAPTASMRPNRIVSLHDASASSPALRGEGVRALICGTRLSRNPVLAGIKHLGRLEQVLAAMEVERMGYNEGLMLDDLGHVVEGTRNNLFVIRDGVLTTPPVDECGIAGVLRGHILEHAGQLGLGVRVEPVPVSSLASVDEIFLCNSVSGVWPVRELGGLAGGGTRILPVGETTARVRHWIEATLGLPPDPGAPA